MDQIIECFKDVDVVQTLILLSAGWFFYNRLDKKIEKVEDRLSKVEIDMVEVKTILRFKECCMIQDDRQMKKAE